MVTSIKILPHIAVSNAIVSFSNKNGVIKLHNEIIIILNISSPLFNNWCQTITVECMAVERYLSFALSAYPPTRRALDD